MGGHRRLCVGRSVIRHLGRLSVERPRRRAGRDALPLLGGDVLHPDVGQDAQEAGAGRHDDGRVDQDRDAETTSGGRGRHRTDFLDAAALGLGQEVAVAGDRLLEGAAVRLALGGDCQAGDAVAVGVARLTREQTSDGLLTLRSDEAGLVDQLHGGVTGLATGGAADVHVGGDTLHHLRGVEAGGTLGHGSLHGVDTGDTHLSGVEFCLAGLELVQVGGEGGIVLGADFRDGGQALDLGLVSRHRITKLVELAHGVFSL